jgi:hypothetical protein
LAKVDCFQLPRRERPIETLPLCQGEQQFCFTLRAPDAADMAMAGEAAQQLTEDYLTGSELRAAASFPAPDVKLSHSLFTTCALIDEMQPAEAEERYGAIELAILSARAPAVWAPLQAKVKALIDAGTRAQGN